MRRLVSGVRAQEVLRAASARVERAGRRLSGPDREAGLCRAGVTRSVHLPPGVDVLHRHVGGSGGKLRLRERVDLRPVEAVSVPRVSVRRDVETVRIRTDVRIVAEARARVTRVRILAPVVSYLRAVDVPRASGVRRLADGDVDVVVQRARIDREHDDEEPLRRRVVET